MAADLLPELLSGSLSRHIMTLRCAAVAAACAVSNSRQMSDYGGGGWHYRVSEAAIKGPFDGEKKSEV